MEALGLRRRQHSGGLTPDEQAALDAELDQDGGAPLVDPEPNADKPKRKRRSKAEMAGEARADDTAARRREADRNKLAGDIAGLIAIPNMVLMTIPATAPDALNDNEHMALAMAFASYAETDPRFKKLVRQVVQKSALATLVGTCTIIALPRLVRHGFLPAALAERLAAAGGSMQPVEAAA